MSAGYGATSRIPVTATTVQARYGGRQQRGGPSYLQPTRASKIRASPRKAAGAGGAPLEVCWNN